MNCIFSYRYFLCSIIVLPLLLCESHAASVFFSYDATGNQSSQQAANAAAPVITGQPNSRQIVVPGGSVGFSVNVASVLPITYQWYFNGTAISGATSDSYFLTNFAAANEGSYTVVATNSLGSATSAVATPYIDANGNGLPDSWEMQYFGNLNQAAGGDYDGDGITNIQEFFDGTNPTVRQPYTWIASSGNFNTPTNWDRNQVPGVGDTAIISSGTFALPTNVTNTVSNVTVNVPFTAAAGANYTLNIAGTWTFNGSVTLTSGYQFAVVGGGSATVVGITDVDGVNFESDGGSTLSLPNVTSTTVPSNLSVTWLAQHPGSALSFPKLASITGPATPNTYLNLQVQYYSGTTGATISLPALTTITKADDGDQYNNSGVEFYAYDYGTISAPNLSTFNDNDSHPNSGLTAANNGVLSLPKLLAPYGVNNINLNAQSNPQQFTSLVGTSSFQINAGTVVMSNLTSIAGLTSILANSGASLTFPNVTSYAGLAGQSVTWQAQEAGSTLSFPNLTTITASATPNAYLNFQVRYDNNGVGATVSLPVLTTITKADDGDQYNDSGVEFYAYDSGVISAPKLSSFQDNDSHPNSGLTAANNGVLSLPKLLAPYGVNNINLNAQSNPQQFTSLVGTSSFQINAGTVVMSNLTSIAGLTSILANSGASLTFPNVTSYAGLAGQSVTWQAQEAGSTLSFPNLTTITASATPNAYLNFQVRYDNNGVGATVSLPVLTTITKADDGDQYNDSGVEFYAYDSGVISAPKLSSFQDNDSHPNSGLTAANNGVLSLPKLLAPYGVNNINLNAQSNPQQFTSLVGTSSFQINAGTVVMSNLTSIAGLTSILANSGASLTFPNVTSYAGLAGQSVTWQAQEAGSTLSFPNLTTITASATPNAYLYLVVQYGSGGPTISLPALTTITKADDGDGYNDSGVQFYAYDGVISAPNLSTFKDNDSHPNSSLNVSGTGTMFLGSLAQSGVRGVTLNGVTLPATITTAPVASSVISALPCTIATPGIYVLNANVSSTQTSGNLITVNASNVVINFQNYTISGPNTASQTTIGIYASEVTNVTIENGTIVHCNTGICLAGNNTATTNSLNQHIDNMRVSKCNSQGIEFTESPASLITNCQISQIGQSTNTYSAGITIYGAGVTVQGCTISTITAASGSNSYCISSAAGSFARQNQLSSATVGLSGGIYQDNVARACANAFTNGTDAGGNSSD